MVCLQSRRPRVGAAAVALYLSGSPNLLGFSTGNPSSLEPALPVCDCAQPPRFRATTDDATVGKPAFGCSGVRICAESLKCSRHCSRAQAKSLMASDARDSPGLSVPARMRANTDAGPRARRHYGSVESNGLTEQVPLPSHRSSKEYLNVVDA